MNKNVDEERLVRASEFMQKLGIKKTKFYQARKAGIIPPPVRLTKTTSAWPISVVNQTISAIIAGQLSL